MSDEIAPEESVEDEHLLVARIVIERTISHEHGDVVWVTAESMDGQADGLPLVEALGMLRLAEDDILARCTTHEEADAPWDEDAGPDD